MKVYDYKAIPYKERLTTLCGMCLQSPVTFHKNAREYSKYSRAFLFHMTKNLTTHLSHNLCAVSPYITIEEDFEGSID